MSQEERINKILTVTVPAYNAEATLARTLDSLLDLPAKLLEFLDVLIIDDGSKDQTAEIADFYADRYPESVRVIHKENAGHGSGINTGIREAKGFYFKVVDADDEVIPDAFASLLRYLIRVVHINASVGNEEQIKACETSAFVSSVKKENRSIPDAVVTGFYWLFDKNGKRKAEIKEPFAGVRYRRIYQFDDIADGIYIKMHALTVRSDILKGQLQHGLTMDVHCYYVDTEYILYPIPWISTVSFLREFVYLYHIGRQGQSVSPERMSANRDNYERVLKSLLRFYKRCQSGDFPCTKQKLTYIANVNARVAASEIKILLSLPVNKETKKQLIHFDHTLQKASPDIYSANQNKAVALLRKSSFHLYTAAASMLRLQRLFGREY